MRVCGRYLGDGEFCMQAEGHSDAIAHVRPDDTARQAAAIRAARLDDHARRLEQRTRRRLAAATVAMAAATVALLALPDNQAGWWILTGGVSGLVAAVLLVCCMIDDRTVGRMRADADRLRPPFYGQ